MLTGAMVIGVVPSNGVYLTLEDIAKHVILSDDCHTCPTKVISIENTLRGMITSLEEVQKISNFAQKHSIKMHLDSARL
jgi:threonine aldolase